MKPTVRTLPRRARGALDVALFGALLVSALVALSPRAAVAADPTKRIALELGGGLSGTAMGEVNDEIHRGNAFLATKDWLELDDVSHGFNFLGSLRGELTRSFGVVLGVGRVSGSTGVDFDQVIDIKSSGSLYFLRGTYIVPFRPRPSVRVFLEAGPIILSGGKLELSHERRTDTSVLRLEGLDVDHSGTGVEGLLSLEMILSETVTFVTDFGYRSLVADADGWKTTVSRVQNPVEDNTGPEGVPNGIPDGQEIIQDSFLLNAFLGPDRQIVPDLQVDYSGLQGSVGLRFYLF